MWIFQALKEITRWRLLEDLENVKENEEDENIIKFITELFIKYYCRDYRTAKIPKFNRINNETIIADYEDEKEERKQRLIWRTNNKNIISLINKYRDMINAFYSRNSNKYYDIKFVNAKEFISKAQGKNDNNEENEEMYKAIKNFVSIYGENNHVY